MLKRKTLSVVALPGFISYSGLLSAETFVFFTMDFSAPSKAELINVSSIKQKMQYRHTLQ